MADEAAIVAMSSVWPDDTGRDGRVPEGVDERADWLWCRGVRFRPPHWFAGLRVCSPPTDGERRASGRLAYDEELVLRAGPWYHPGIAADTAFLHRYLCPDGFLPGRRGYSLATVGTWEWQVRVLCWPSDLLCPTWTVTAVQAQREGRVATLAERHAMFIRIIGVRRARFGEYLLAPGRL